VIRPDKDHYITLVSSFVSCAVGVTDWAAVDKSGGGASGRG